MQPKASRQDILIISTERIAERRKMAGKKGSIKNKK